MGDREDERDNDKRDEDEEPDVFFGSGPEYLEWQKQIARERRERKKNRPGEK